MPAEEKAPAPSTGKPKEVSKHHWYDFLELLIPLKDVILFLGVICITIGVAFIYWPAGLIVFGGFLLSLAWMMARI